MIYLDSCAIVKLIVNEPESADLVDWLDDRADEPRATSALAEVEVPRAIRRTYPRQAGEVPVILARLYRAEIDELVRDTAAAYTEPLLRTLDAIHLGTAAVLSAAGVSLSAFVTYDARLARAALASGFPLVAPGAADKP